MSGRRSQLVGDAGEIITQFGERHLDRRGFGAYEVVAGRETTECVDSGHDRTQAPTNPVADDRIADRPSDAIRDPGSGAGSSEVADADRAAAYRASMPPKGIKIIPVGESANQAERRVRPF
jgi:hypothetical protein